MRETRPGLKIKESPLRIALSMSAPVMLAIVAVSLWVADAALWAVIAAAVVAILLGLFVLFDFTLSVSIDDAGITRRCVARTLDIPWSDIDRLYNPKRRGLIAVTEKGTHHILIDRRLYDSERDLFATQARLHGVDYLTMTSS